MKKYFFILFFLFLFTFPVKANPWLVIEGIGLGVQILEAGAKKLKDVNQNRKSKKKQKQEANKLREGSKIITFSQCDSLQPNYLPETIFRVDLDNKYIKADQGGKNKLIFFKVNKIQNSKIISTQVFSPNKKDQKKIEELYKYIGFLITFDVILNSIDIRMFLKGNAPKKIKKKFYKNIKKKKIALNTSANCYVTGKNFLIKEKKKKNNNTTQNYKVAKWVAIVTHKKKNTIYASDDIIEINTKEKAVNNAKSKCWFDPKHKVGDWPYSNCLIVSVKSKSSEKEIAAAKEKKKRLEAKRKARKAKEKARRDTNKKWIIENKKKILYGFIEKINQYRDNISELKLKREQVIDKFKNLEIKYNNTNRLIEDVLVDLNNENNQSINLLVNKINNNKKLYTSNSNLEYYQSKVENIKKIKYENYINYKLLQDLIDRSAKSNKIESFIGTNEIKFLGFTFKQNKIGFIQEFKNIKNKDLGSTSKIDLKNLDQLQKDIDINIQNIKELILDPTVELQLLDKKLVKRNFYINFLKQNPFYKSYQLLNTFVEMIK